MDWSTLGVAMGSAWLSGINLYATVATLGLLQKFGFVKLPGELGILSNGWVLGVAGVMYIVEFFADKIPAVDSAWDAVHTFIRVPAGAILTAFSPVAILIIVILFIILLIWLIPKIYRTLRWLMRKLRSLFGSAPQGNVVES